ncbi:MAG: hypothetical protein OXB84_03190 [Halobacteriovoraceae bacterium]|nr:hypothetical protein [Halobacteriovoraceae bacterium]
MGILTKPEFYSLKKEFEKIKGLIGKIDEDLLLQGIEKILKRLDESKKARIKRAKLKVLK